MGTSLVMLTANPTMFYAIGAIVLILVIVAAFAIARRAQSARLHRHFGPEYDRVARERGSSAAAERELTRREERVRTFNLQELPPGARERYAEEWRQVQSQFVDQPIAALRRADSLIANVMRDRGYPPVNFEQRTADLSPHHARVLDDYRTANEISVRNNDADTEELRQAMVHYRALFDDLVESAERTKA